MKPHKNLDSWKLSFALVKEIYLATTSFPSDEKFGITSPMRRASISIPSNIAEGFARKTKNEFLYFLHIVEGSVSELDTLILLTSELNFIERNSANNLLLKLEDISKRIMD